jgi:predicted peptidase
LNTETGFLDRTVALGDTEYRYQIYVPREYTPDRKWPVVLFLHGSGESGDDGLLQTEVGIGGAIRRYRDRFPCIVVMPQCRPNHIWTGAMEVQALQALEETAYAFNGDRDRIFLTGLSLGGLGTWSIAVRHPGRFAAIVPICGWIVLPQQDLSANDESYWSRHGICPDDPDPFKAASEQIGATPVWVFHGDADEVVAVEQSRQMVTALEAAGGNVQYTECPGVGHNVWEMAYADEALMPWLLTQ